MSQNQIRGNKELQYRKTGVVGGVRHNNSSGYQQRPLSGVSGTGNGTASPPYSNSPTNRSPKKPNNAQVGNSKGESGTVNSLSDSNQATRARPVENGSHVQSTVSAPAVVTKPPDTSGQKSSQAVAKAPCSQTSSMTSVSTLPATPSKGDGGKGFPFQFGSINAGYMNVMQVPARTSSAPPNMDEQQRDQALRSASRVSPTNHVSSAPKQQMSVLEGPAEHPSSQEPHTITKVTRDVPVTSAPAPPPIQTQKPATLPVAGISMPMQYTQPTGHMQFGGPNAQIQSQAMRANSHQMPMQIPLPMGNPTQVQQQVFGPGLQHHLMPNQGIIHQGQSFGFNPQMGNQLPHQPLNLGMNMSPQFNQQAGKFNSARRTVKITHPGTHEELRLDEKNGGSPGSRVNHVGHPQSQSHPPYTAARPGGFYSNSYTPGSPFIQQPSSIPLAGSSLAPRLNYSAQVLPPAVPYVNQAASTSLSVSMGTASMPGRPESSNLASVCSAPHLRPYTHSLSASTPVTVKAAGASAEERGSVRGIEKAESAKVSGPATEAVVMSRELKANSDSSSVQSKPHFEPSEHSDVSALASTNRDVSKEAVMHLNHLEGTPAQSGQKGYLGKSKDHGEYSKPATPESPAVKFTRGPPGSKMGVEAVEHNTSARVEDQLSKDQDAIQNDCHPQSATKEESVTDHCEGFQSGNHLKAMNNVSKLEQPDELKKPDHVADVEEPSQAKATDAVDSGIETHHPANLSEANVGVEVEIMENARPSSSSGIVSGSSKEPNKTKNNRGKKKRKEMLLKAEALGANADLYMAYKGPEENKGATSAAGEGVAGHSFKEMSAGARLDDGSPKKNWQNKQELEDWEDAADGSTPKLGSSDNGKRRGFHQDDDGASVKKYSRDFLLTLSEQCTGLPEGFEVTSEIHALMLPDVNASRDYSSTARIIERPSGPARHDRRGNGLMDVDRWGKSSAHLPNRDPGVDLTYAAGNMMGFRPGVGANYGVIRPRGQGPVQHAGGILPGVMHSMNFQGTQRNSTDGDRWQRATNFNKGLMPPPQTVMHKAEKKYEVGKVSDEEQAKQRRLKAILNKLTPQNFDKLFEQVKEVNIDNVVTLAGVISQIFDKALMEPTFCEMYANFCHHLASELPDLTVDNQKITFRRLLLNKCQEEFERGEREEEEANKDEGETRQSDQEREAKRLEVRRRMLGNIRLIGELYKKRMLTERIMHECIKKLLGQYQNADEENIEALCKLMSTIGEMIDHPKAKEHMDAYFDIMSQLSNDMKLSSRVRFLLKDTIDLRKNKWQQRRKVEGPKKIEEVHKAAAQERLGQTSRLSRGPSMNSAARRGQPTDYSPRGSMLSSAVGQVGGYRGPSAHVRGYFGQDARVDKIESESRILSVPLLHRSSGDEPITLGPQGGLARGMSCRGQPLLSPAPTADNFSSHEDAKRGYGGLNGFSNVSDRGTNSSRGVHFPKHGAPVSNDHSSSQEHILDIRSTPASSAGTTTIPKLSLEKAYPEERLREMSMAAIKEFYSAKDVKEAELCIKELNAPSFYPTVVSMWVTDAFERKELERNVLTRLLVTLTKPQEGMFSRQQLMEGFDSVLANFEDIVTDAPRAPEFLGRMFGSLVLENVLPLQDLGSLIHQGGEEPGRLLKVGLAADVLGSILEMIKSEKGDATLNEIRTSSKLRLEDFLPPEPLISKKLAMFI